MFHDAKKRTVRLTPWGLVVGGLLLLLVVAEHSTHGQVLLRRVREAPIASPETNSEEDEDFAGGASLKTDPDLDQLLRKADEFASDGRHDLACVLWQRVLDESAGTVMTREDWTTKTFKRMYRRYRSVAGEIEQTIAKLPDEGLRVYRLSADGEAKAVLATGEGDQLEEALSQVTRRYFLSSQGDDAAYQLACLRMDRYDFVGASRLLVKVIEEYPDPSVPQDELLLRLAVASSRVGDQQLASKTLDKLKASRRFVSERLVSLVADDMKREGITAVQTASATDDWPIDYGNSARTGHMKSLPKAITGKTLSELWTGEFETAVQVAGGRQQPQVYEEFDRLKRLRRPYQGTPQQQQVDQSRADLVARWTQTGWQPAGHVLIHQGQVYYKSSDRVVASNLQTGELVWMGRRNRFQMDQLSLIYAQQGGANGRPASPPEVLLFGDRVHQGMVISDGLLFNIEGELFDDFGQVSTPQGGREVQYGYGGSVQRSRRNWLAAYEAQNGKLKWHRSAGGEENGKFEVGFLAAPVPFARFLLAPISDNGALWLIGMDKLTGNTVWKTFLCDDPTSGASPWSPVAVAVDGGDAYVSTGAGVIFALDALSGMTRWAVRYQRSGVSGNVNQNQVYGVQMLAQLNGWKQDMVIPHGKNLVVMASDSDELFAVDRRTGEFLWDSPRTPYSEVPPGEYCIGVMGEALYVGGKNIVRRYDVPSGRLMWEAKLENSLGRAALTEDAVFVPENDTIVRLDLEGGKRVAQVGVFTTEKEPVGNLFTDGKRLLVLGLGKIYALTDLSYRLELLAERIKAGDVTAQLERMRLRHLDGDQNAALDDLRAAYATLIARRQTEQAITTLCTGINDLSLASRDPRAVMDLIAAMPTKIETESSPPQPLPESLTLQRGEMLKHALQNIIDSNTKGAASQILAVVPLCSEEHLIRAARSAMAATATKTDSDLLKKSLASQIDGERTVAMAGLSAALGDEAGNVLVGLLADSSDKVKSEAAWALGNAGDRRALAAFGQLLNSDDIKVRVSSVQALRALTGKRIKFSAYDDAETRATGVKQWNDWIAGEGQTAKLEFPIREGAFMLGRTLICYYSKNQVIELDSAGEEVWKQDVQYAWGCQGLPDGHRLIASYSGRFVAEYDEDGKEVWKKTGLPGAPFSVQRLDDGNTLVTCSDSQKVIEIAPDKSLVWEVSLEGRPMDARRLDSGNTLVALQTVGKVVEVDRSGKVVWEATDQGGALSASRLDNGNTLICRSGNNMVVEINRDGEIVWAQRDLRNPYDAQRLPSGNTLIADFTGVREVNPKGEVVWQRDGQGASRVHRY